MVSKSLQKHFLTEAHEHAEHQGAEWTLDRLIQNAYLARDVAQYCSHCIKCQTIKVPPGVPAPLQPVIAS